MDDHIVTRIRELITSHQYSIKQHAHRRMVERGIYTDDIELIVAHGELIESDLKRKPLPTYLFMYSVRGTPLYVVCAYTQDWVYIITVYWYDSRKWINPRTRAAN